MQGEPEGLGFRAAPDAGPRSRPWRPADCGYSVADYPGPDYPGADYHGTNYLGPDYSRRWGRERHILLATILDDWNHGTAPCAAALIALPPSRGLLP